MRQVLTVAILILVGLPFVGASGETPQIVDVEGDAGVDMAPTVLLPHPATDILSVTFVRQGDQLDVAMEVSDIDYLNDFVPFAGRDFAVFFHSETYSQIIMAAYERSDGTWGSTFACDKDGHLACFRRSADATVNVHDNTLTISAPLDWVGGRVIEPRATTSMAYNRMLDLWPTVFFGDEAPNTGYGRDYDPYG